MNILAARKYPTPRNGPLTLDEAETRRLAYAIKTTASPSADFDQAAREMAAVLLRSMASPALPLGGLFRSINSQPSTINQLWLVPIPSSDGNTDANARLAHLIACHLADSPLSTLNPQPILAQVIKAIQRTRPVQSQCARHKLALGPIPPAAHYLARTRKPLTLRQTFFVDNVTAATPWKPPARPSALVPALSSPMPPPPAPNSRPRSSDL